MRRGVSVLWRGVLLGETRGTCAFRQTTVIRPSRLPPGPRIGACGQELRQAIGQAVDCRSIPDRPKSHSLRDAGERVADVLRTDA